MSSALSLEQAPPLSVPMRFFLTAPVFGMLAAGLLLWAGPDALASRWMPFTLALSHLLGLGVLTMTMCGALFQLLPVLVGARVALRWVVGLCHAGLVLGCLVLAGAFLGNSPIAFRLAMLLLGIGLGPFIAIVGFALVRAPRPDDTGRGMRWALLALTATLLLGLLLAAGHGWETVPLWRFPLTDLHMAWALLGWVATLVAAVSYQVVPMFQMTPFYPAVPRRWLAPGIAGALAGLSLLTLEFPAMAWLPNLMLAGTFTVFSVLTLRLLAQRRRKLADASLVFWRVGMLALAASAGTGALELVAPVEPGSALALAPALLFLPGFALLVVCGMLYKIVPFLVWLHLQQRIGGNPAARRRIFPPNMKTLVPERRARIHCGLHVAALVLLLAGLALPVLVRPAAVLWLASFAVLGGNLLVAVHWYRVECQRIDAMADLSASPD